MLAPPDPLEPLALTAPCPAPRALPAIQDLQVTPAPPAQLALTPPFPALLAPQAPPVPIAPFPDPWALLAQLASLAPKERQARQACPALLVPILPSLDRRALPAQRATLVRRAQQAPIAPCPAPKDQLAPRETQAQPVPPDLLAIPDPQALLAT